MGMIGREQSVVGEFGQPATQGITYLDGPAFFCYPSTASLVFIIAMVLTWSQATNRSTNSRTPV